MEGVTMRVYVHKYKGKEVDFIDLPRDIQAKMLNRLTKSQKITLIKRYGENIKEFEALNFDKDGVLESIDFHLPTKFSYLKDKLTTTNKIKLIGIMMTASEEEIDVAIRVALTVYKDMTVGGE